MPAHYLEKEKIEEDFGFLDSFDENTKHYDKLKGLDGVDIQEKIGMTPLRDYSLNVYPDEGENFLVAMLNHKTKEIIYYIKCKVWEDVCLSNKPVTQVLLWRTDNYIDKEVTHKLTSKVFFNYLLKTYNLIASDSYQTLHGRHFWVAQMSEALSKGHKVYRYDRIMGETIELTSFNDIRNNTCDLWGDDDEYANVLALIGDI